MIIYRYRYQERFARDIGWSRAMVSRVINGQRLLSRDEAGVWAEALNCDIIDLFCVLAEPPLIRRPSLFRKIINAVRGAA